MLSLSATSASSVGFSQKWSPLDAEADAFFGVGVALDGEWALVGAEGDDGQGAAYVFDAATGTQLRKLTAPDGDSNDRFGSSLALDAGVALVGAQGSDFGAGSAYLLNASTGSLIQKLTAADGDFSDRFGRSVALRDGVALVGAPFHGSDPRQAGAAYVFDATTGSLSHKLTAPDGARNDFFGLSVAIGGGIVAVGAPSRDNENGAVYLFDATSGAFLRTLVAPESLGGDYSGYFGRSLAIDDGVLLVGADLDPDRGRFAGSAYLFDAANGTLLHKLTAFDAADNDQFGWSVALDDGVALVGAREEGFTTGSAYRFDVASGLLLQKFKPSGLAGGDRFGASVALGDSDALVGAFGDDDNGADSGAAYVYDVSIDPADFNNDGVVDAADYTLWRDAQATGVFDASADANGDGAIDVMDYNVWFTTFGDAAPSGSATVPEPTAAALALAAAAALARRRRG